LGCGLSQTLSLWAFGGPQTLNYSTQNLKEDESNFK